MYYVCKMKRENEFPFNKKKNYHVTKVRRDMHECRREIRVGILTEEKTPRMVIKVV